jgi:hypothetical protein
MLVEIIKSDSLDIPACVSNVFWTLDLLNVGCANWISILDITWKISRSENARVSKLRNLSFFLLPDLTALHLPSTKGSGLLPAFQKYLPEWRQTYLPHKVSVFRNPEYKHLKPELPDLSPSFLMQRDRSFRAALRMSHKARSSPFANEVDGMCECIPSYPIVNYIHTFTAGNVIDRVDKPVTFREKYIVNTVFKRDFPLFLRAHRTDYGCAQRLRPFGHQRTYATCRRMYENGISRKQREWILPASVP